MSAGSGSVHRVAVLALPDVVAFDLAVPAQVFGHRDERDRYEVLVCSATEALVPTTTGFSITAAGGLADVVAADTVVVPGYWPPADPGPEVVRALQAAADRGARVASVCVGAFALAAAGLLDERAATTHWQHARELAARHPRVRLDPDVLFVDEGPVLTSAGVAAGIDLCLHMYATDHGAEAAAAVSRRMVAALHRPGGQAQFIRRPLPPHGGDDTIAQLCAWLVGQLPSSISVEDMARHALMSTRTFTRRFAEETGLAPLRWLTSQRVLEARRLLEATDLPVEEVARRSGLGSADSLRLHLAREASTTPSAYRAAFRARPPT
ncbi:MAG: GlxA family transcriptional regulator [Janthinobacterium lividum]